MNGGYGPGSPFGPAGPGGPGGPRILSPGGPRKPLSPFSPFSLKSEITKDSFNLNNKIISNENFIINLHFGSKMSGMVNSLVCFSELCKIVEWSSNYNCAISRKL